MSIRAAITDLANHTVIPAGSIIHIDDGVYLSKTIILPDYDLILPQLRVGKSIDALLSHRDYIWPYLLQRGKECRIYLRGTEDKASLIEKITQRRVYGFLYAKIGSLDLYLSKKEYNLVVTDVWIQRREYITEPEDLKEYFLHDNGMLCILDDIFVHGFDGSDFVRGMDLRSYMQYGDLVTETQHRCWKITLL